MNTPTKQNNTRCRRDFYIPLNNEMISKFKDKYPTYADLSKEDMSKIIYAFNEQLYREVIYKRDGVYLPEDMGLCYITSCKLPDKTSLDPKALHSSGQKVMFKNLHTDGNVAKIVYSNFDRKFKFATKEMWSFNPYRKFTRETSAYYRENWMNYIQVSSSREGQNARKLKDEIKEFISDQAKVIIPADYDEFKMD